MKIKFDYEIDGRIIAFGLLMVFCVAVAVAQVKGNDGVKPLPGQIALDRMDQLAIEKGVDVDTLRLQDAMRAEYYDSQNDINRCASQIAALSISDENYQTVLDFTEIIKPYCPNIYPTTTTTIPCNEDQISCLIDVNGCCSLDQVCGENGCEETTTTL